MQTNPIFNLKEQISYRLHLHLERHLRVVNEPVLCEEAYAIIALNESKVRAYVHLTLIPACHLEKQFLLPEESIRVTLRARLQ